MDMTVILVAIVIVGLVFVMFSIKIILKKDGEFVGTCASNSPFLQKEGVTCDVCGKTVTKDTVCEDESNKTNSSFD